LFQIELSSKFGYQTTRHLENGTIINLTNLNLRLAAKIDESRALLISNGSTPEIKVVEVFNVTK
jgi:hypothetical protein